MARTAILRSLPAEANLWTVDDDATRLVLEALFDIRRILDDIREVVVGGEEDDEAEGS